MKHNRGPWGIPVNDPRIEEEIDCQEPCAPDSGCALCADYWERMRSEGFWIDESGWTEAGLREMRK